MRRKLGISTRIVAGLVAAAIVGTLQTSTAGAVTSNAARAKASYDAINKYFNAGQDLLLEEYPNQHPNPYSYIWPYSQAAVAAENIAGIPGSGPKASAEAERRIDAYSPYWNATTTPKGYDSYVRAPLGGGGDKFYDDNEWIGLHLIQNYKRTGDRTALARAKEIFTLVVHGWDTDPAHPCAGGVYWTQAPWSQDRNTVSNGPGAELGAHLYLLTRDRLYLTWAKRMYQWAQDCMLAPNGLYWDHIDLAGTIEKTQWSYNQGVMLGAGVLLFKATGDHRYLRDAKSVANASLGFYNTREILAKNGAAFNSIWFKNLLILDSVAPDPRYRQAMQAYADDNWNTTRDPATNLYKFREGPVELLQQSGITQVHALLAWPRSRYHLLA
ncbi:glycoside hydrolase family 76 protein [Kribbella albertanoniae]|uniref:Glycosyl hydrolase n=1 Tax=Kribbella albertanoniae TaxID=1266829 RepID=A0A4R4PID6_9ACTN|nr:glycoside hydrolase family 76 protein [Kribbella albertanoniae]TDC21656.1 glycosyl hydrolase [Kribbella albertanoniae]